MKVVLSSEAQGDLLAIGDFIAQDNQVRAKSFVEELLAKAAEIGASPEAFPLVSFRRDIRRRVHGAYLIFYRIEPDRILVVHILHGARDYEALL